MAFDEKLQMLNLLSIQGSFGFNAALHGVHSLWRPFPSAETINKTAIPAGYE